MELGIVDLTSPGTPGEAQSHYEYQIEYQWFDPTPKEWVKGATYRFSERPNEPQQTERLRLLSLVMANFKELQEQGNTRELRLYRRLVTHYPWDEVFGEQALQKSADNTALGSDL